jgi:hypothetical protein
MNLTEKLIDINCFSDLSGNFNEISPKKKTLHIALQASTG